MRKWACCNFFLIYIKKEWAQFRWENLLSKNRDAILNRPKDYYENDRKRLKKQARDKYRNLSEQEKIKRENMKKIDIVICLKKRSKD